MKLKIINNPINLLQDVAFIVANKPFSVSLKKALKMQRKNLIIVYDRRRI